MTWYFSCIITLRSAMSSRGFVLLNNGLRMPSIGLGTYQVTRDSVQAAVDSALDIGYRHIDTAYSYGNERDIGEVLDTKLRAGSVKRSTLFVTTKVPNDRLGESDVRVTVEESLDRLRLKHLDLVLVHSPWGQESLSREAMKEKRRPTEEDFIHYDLVATWRALEKLVGGRRVRSIGLSNFTEPQIERIWRCAIVKPANLQLECHAYLQQSALRTYCRQRGISVTAYAPLGAPKRPARHTHKGNLHLLSDPAVQDIARQLGRTPAQILLSFLLQLGVSPLPKTVRPERMEENLRALDFTIGKENMDRLEALNQNMKFFRFAWFRNHPEYDENEDF